MTAPDTTVFCTFEQKLTAGDLGRLSKYIGAVVPIPFRHHLIGHTAIGLHRLLDERRAYARLRTLLRDMTLTIVRRLEGNQMLLGIPVHGHCYTVQNTGPVLWEKGDQLVLCAPLLPPDPERAVRIGGWSLVLPWIIPQPLAMEINQRLLVIALLSLERPYEQVRAATAQLRTIHYRDATFSLPDVQLDEPLLDELKTVCLSMSMVTNLASELVQTYVRRLALEDHSMLLLKCQELLARRTAAAGGRREDDAAAAAAAVEHLDPRDEVAKLTAFFVMVRQLVDVVTEQPVFQVCDVAPDNKSATCLFKG
ncbi:T85 [Tupaiid betaherpesvirus 1]|uniref:T85 n=1 Tax=Tupaiid herpesvirus 1 (strain 1) TaxID=10397 RepID=Q91TL2_TUHV1|nr:T85 [Tupaiid betaherpesvirus 1]AAK57129.1 T85 [Tupaiid betaherpesvirus 1]